MTKKKRTQKRKQAAAARQNTSNETPQTVISKEKTPAIETEKGATAMFAEAKSVSPKRVVPLEKISAPNAHDFDDKNTEASKQYPLPTKIGSSVPALQPQGTSPDDELMLLRLMYLNWIQKKMMESGDVMHEPLDLDLNAFKCSNSSNSVIVDVDDAEDQRTFAHREDDAVEKNQDDLVRPNNVVVPGNQEIFMVIEENVEEKYQEAAAAQNQEAVISVEVNDIEKNILEAIEHGEKFVAVHDNEEAVPSTKPGGDRLYPTHDAVSTQVVPPEVLKQLQTIKEIIEDVLNRVNAKDAHTGGSRI